MALPHKQYSGTLGRWAMLLAWCAGIWCFVFLVAPLLQNVGPVRTLTDFIRANDIDATAYYYTEVEEFAVAEHSIRDTMNHAHRE